MVLQRMAQNFCIVFENEDRSPLARTIADALERREGVHASQPLSVEEYRTSVVTSTPDGLPAVNANRALFIGSGSESQEYAKAVAWYFDKFGMKFGWLGDCCVITVEQRPLAPFELLDFIRFYNDEIPKFSHLPNSPQQPLDRNPLNISQNNPWTIREHQYELVAMEFIFRGLNDFCTITLPRREQVILVYSPKDASYAHLMSNLIAEYCGYNVLEIPDKMFMDTKKKMAGNVKVVFLGDTKSSQQLFGTRPTTVHNQHGLQIDVQQNRVRLTVSPLTSNKAQEAFVETYERKRKYYEDAGKKYAVENPQVGKDHISLPLAAAATRTSAFFSVGALGAVVGLPVLVISSLAFAQGNIKKLVPYQYQLLIREFVFNYLDRFMRA